MNLNHSAFRTLSLLGTLAVLATPATARRSTMSGGGSVDRTFMIHAAQANIGEVKGGQLALTRAVSAPVRDFAQHMIVDHNAANMELKGLARSKRIRLPNDTDLKHKQIAGRLAKNSGDTFDRAYIKAMVKGHKEVIAMFQKEASNGRDPDVRAWAAKTLPALQEHLQHAMQASEEVHSHRRNR